jgi:hypothetical protein
MHPPPPSLALSAAAAARWLLATLCALAAVVALVAPAGTARAAELNEAEARGARAVVEAQLAAMAAGNDALAFSFASAGIQAQFGNADTFMQMVRAGYPMVIKPAATAFFRAERVDETILLRVQLRDREGRRWLAIYKLLQLPDAGWRIDGCVVQPDRGGGNT